jgi:hypothetical protein
MAVKTQSVADGDTLDRLDALRLSKDWSFRELSLEMARVGVALSAATLHQVLTDRESKPYDRTLHKIRRYLDELPTDRKPTARKPKGRAA